MKSLSKNMILSLISRVVTLVTGLVVQRYILIAYGSTFNGLTSSIGQIMSYLVLLEAGLGAASIQVLYSPLSEGNWSKINSILTATGKEYKKISCMFTGLLVLVSLLLPIVTADEVEYRIAALLTLIIGASYVLSYIIGGKYKALLNADRKIYVLHELDIITNILSCILRLWALQSGRSIVTVQLINLFTVFIKNTGYVIYIRRKYPSVDYHAKPNYGAISKRWNVLVHNIAGIVVNHTDIMILTICSSLKIVSVYSVYNMVFSQLSNMISSTFMQAPQATFGNLYYKDRSKFEKAFTAYETLYTIGLYILVTISLIMILPFVSVYTKGVSDVDYLDAFLPILFSATLLMNQLRTPAIITVNVVGAYKETQRGAVIEAVINIVVSLALFFFTDFGLYGLLIGTVCSYLFRTLEVLLFVYRKILCVSISQYVRLLLTNTLILIGLYVVAGTKIFNKVDTFADWILYAVVVSVLTTMIYILLNLLFNKSKILEIVKHLALFSTAKRG